MGCLTIIFNGLFHRRLTMLVSSCHCIIPGQIQLSYGYIQPKRCFQICHKCFHDLGFISCPHVRAISVSPICVRKHKLLSFYSARLAMRVFKVTWGPQALMLVMTGGMTGWARPSKFKVFIPIYINDLDGLVHIAMCLLYAYCVTRYCKREGYG